MSETHMMTTTTCERPTSTKSLVEKVDKAREYRVDSSDCE